MRTRAILGFVGVILIAGRISAAPLEVKQVAAGSKWVVHLDVDAVRASSVVQRAWKKGLEKHKDAEAKLGVLKSMIGMDPTKDVHGITAYGDGFRKPHGVVVISATMNPERLVGMAAALPGRETTKHGDHEIHSWKKSSKTAAAAFHGKEHLIIGHSVDAVRDALDVIDGKGDALTTDGPLGGNIPPGTTFLLRADGIAEADLKCRTPVVKLIRSVRLVTGESDGTSFFRARFNMTTREATELGLQAVKGWQAQGNLLCPDELGRKFINALRPKADGESLTLLWSAPADDVWQAMQSMQSAIAKKMARHRHRAASGGCPLCTMCRSGQCPLCASHSAECKCDECQKAHHGESPIKASSEEDF